MDPRSALGAVALLVLGACHDDSSDSAPFTLTNLGISAVSLQGSGELWVLEVPELGENAADLNGDGDTADNVPFVYDLADGSLTNLALDLGRVSGPGARGFPLPFLAVGDVLVAFGVSEADQDAADLNGDGDTLDIVLHVYDDVSGLVTNTALAAVALRPAIGVGLVAFGVSESGQDGQDLDGDGTTSGFVLHVYDSRTGLTTNAQRNLTSEITFHDHAFAITTDEPSAGADLNGDGDQADVSVFQMYDRPLGGMEEVPLAVRGRPLAVNADDWFLLADEGETGLDLNGDLDTNDGVVHEVHPHLGTLQALGLSSTGSFGSVVDGADLALVVQEIDGLDRNGDGDFSDALVVLYASGLAQTFDPGLAIDTSSTLVFAGNQLAFPVDETSQGADLNGDGDLDDDVLHLLERTAGLVTNLGLDVLALQGGGGRLLFARSETDAATDWNGDGDLDDVVLFYRDPLTGTITSTGLASTGLATASTTDSILLTALESGEHEDLNGDGDLGDSVFVLHDVSSGTNTSLRVARSVPDAGLDEDGRGVLLVSEADQGLDLNGDGDLGDSVLHRLEVR